MPQQQDPPAAVETPPADGTQPSTSAPEDEDEQETCGFCRFMKGGGCRQAFIDWSDCVDKEKARGEDFTEECKDKTLALRECMLLHKDYYAPLLEEEEDFVAEQQEEADAAEATAPVQAAAAAAAAAAQGG